MENYKIANTLTCAMGVIILCIASYYWVNGIYAQEYNNTIIIVFSVISVLSSLYSIIHQTMSKLVKLINALSPIFFLLVAIPSIYYSIIYPMVSFGIIANIESVGGICGYLHIYILPSIVPLLLVICSIYCLKTLNTNYIIK